MIDLVQLKSFMLVAEKGSFVAASRILAISTPAVSQQVNRLEQHLGIQLLTRTTKKVELTEIGSNYYAQCQRIFKEVDSAEQLVSKIKMVPQGLLKVVANRHYAESFITPFLKDFLTKYPEIELHLELAERMPDMEKEDIDILIGMSLSASGEVIQKRISSTHYCYLASTKYLEKMGCPKKLSDLPSHCYLTHSMRNPNHILNHKKESVTLKPYLYANDIETLIKLCLDNLGIIKVHYYAAKKHLEEGHLIEILTQYKEPSIPLFIAYRQQRFVPSKVRVFIDFFG